MSPGRMLSEPSDILKSHCMGTSTFRQAKNKNTKMGEKVIYIIPFNGLKVKIAYVVGQYSVRSHL